ncbi:MAG TPA: MBL fold metallo-hydrolase [Kiritimatiellia bacterium]|nr:MBL fold metallo-hydrolase [Kiritimatiellia bacterium]HNR93101.1 MBL fold metallo-hydrolase [Kiritimatiellia bacterium]HNS80636.1 MBL fold metallo-hydrolase [Kiritimatiellia bacterium]HPA77713.1 MBL fold metallo-hydrolase [Kiritimatiellia bacterium]
MRERVCVLASGSSGNCTFVSADGVSILVDAGISGRETERRLEEIGEDPGRLRAICVSHEHTDHTAGIGVLHRRYATPLFANSGTINGIGRQRGLAGLPWNVFTTGQPFQIGTLQIEPVSVPHDAYDPVGFIIRSSTAAIGVVTDMGMATALIRTRLRDCDALVIETNHDETMLQNAQRPWMLKQRIMGRQGHLSNRQAAAVIEEIAGPRLKQIFLAHISSDCNEAWRAEQEIRQTVEHAGLAHIQIACTFPDRISAVWQPA